jgi:hypothetical protein
MRYLVDEMALKQVFSESILFFSVYPTVASDLFVIVLWLVCDIPDWRVYLRSSAQTRLLASSRMENLVHLSEEIHGFLF